jgi:hypothetical protein
MMSEKNMAQSLGDMAQRVDETGRRAWDQDGHRAASVPSDEIVGIW